MPRAAGQFFALLKGEPHACMVFGGPGPAAAEIEAHLAAAVDLFLRAYQAPPTAAAKSGKTAQARR